MTKDEKTEILFEIINKGKMIGNPNGLSIKMATPFDFKISEEVNDKTIKFEDLSEAVSIISEFAGNENADKIKEQLISQSKNQKINIKQGFYVEFIIDEIIDK